MRWHILHKYVTRKVICNATPRGGAAVRPSEKIYLRKKLSDTRTRRDARECNQGYIHLMKLLTYALDRGRGRRRHNLCHLWGIKDWTVVTRSWKISTGQEDSLRENSWRCVMVFAQTLLGDAAKVPGENTTFNLHFKRFPRHSTLTESLRVSQLLPFNYS